MGHNYVCLASRKIFLFFFVAPSVIFSKLKNGKRCLIRDLQEGVLFSACYHGITFVVTSRFQNAFLSYTAFFDMFYLKKKEMYTSARLMQRSSSSLFEYGVFVASSSGDPPLTAVTRSTIFAFASSSAGLVADTGSVSRSVQRSEKRLFSKLSSLLEPKMCEMDAG